MNGNERGSLPAICRQDAVRKGDQINLPPLIPGSPFRLNVLKVSRGPNKEHPREGSAVALSVSVPGAKLFVEQDDALSPLKETVLVPDKSSIFLVEGGQRILQIDSKVFDPGQKANLRCCNRELGVPLTPVLQTLAS